MPTDPPNIVELRAAVQVDQERADIQRTIQLDKIRRRHTSASNGPWTSTDLRHQQGGQIRIWPAESAGRQIANVLRSGPNPAADADLIVHATTDIGWLLAEVDRLNADLNRHPTCVGCGVVLRDHQRRVPLGNGTVTCVSCPVPQPPSPS